MLFARLRDDLIIRLWGDDLASNRCYRFDFINNEQQCILKPDDVKIHVDPLDVLDIETLGDDTLEILDVDPVYFDPINQVLTKVTFGTSLPVNREDYLASEGSTLLITQQNRPDLNLYIPMRL